MDHATEGNGQDVLTLAVDIVSAYVSNNSVAADSMPKFIADVYSAITNLASNKTSVPVEEPKAPAVPIKKSITADYLICLEDGLKFKSLKRHLRTKYDISPEQYRAKWNLPADYPMVAPAYAQARSELAKSMGLGQKASQRGKKPSSKRAAA